MTKSQNPLLEKLVASFDIALSSSLSSISLEKITSTLSPTLARNEIQTLHANAIQSLSSEALESFESIVKDYDLENKLSKKSDGVFDESALDDQLTALESELSALMALVEGAEGELDEKSRAVDARIAEIEGINVAVRDAAIKVEELKPVV